MMRKKKQSVNHFHQRTFWRSFAGISVIVFLVSYPIHFLWENLQVPLYECSKLTGQEIVPHLLRATLGDAVIMMVIYWVGCLVSRQPDWLFSWTKWRVGLVLLLGLIISVAIEINAVQIQLRWSYQPTMPTVFGVGLVPVVQLLILPFLIFWLTRRLLVGRKL